MKKKNIIQFMPYFPPHMWWLEKVWEDIFLKWTYWKNYVFSWEIDKKTYVYNKENNSNIDRKIYRWYPSFDIVDNFPFPLIWTKSYRNITKELNKIIRDNPDEEFYVITHTRFFLSSFLGWRFAKQNKLKWIHIEHWSDYVKLSSSFKNKIAYLYDKTLGSYVFKNTYKTLAISDACKIFVEKEFRISNVDIWYRGIDMPKIEPKKNDEIKIVFIWRLVHLKWVDILLRSYAIWNINLELLIFWDGEDKEKLMNLTRKLWLDSKVVFKWYTESSEMMNFLQLHKCILVNPSYQEGMPTTVIEGLSTKNVVIASDVWGTREISDKEDLRLIPAWNVESLHEQLLYAFNNYSTLEGKSYQHIYKNFSWEKSIENLYLKLD